VLIHVFAICLLLLCHMLNVQSIKQRWCSKDSHHSINFHLYHTYYSVALFFRCTIPVRFISGTK